MVRVVGVVGVNRVAGVDGVVRVVRVTSSEINLKFWLAVIARSPSDPAEKEKSSKFANNGNVNNKLPMCEGKRSMWIRLTGRACSP